MMPQLLALDRSDVGTWFNDHGTAVFGTLALALVAAFLIRRVVPHALRPAVVRQMSGRPAEEVDRRVDTLGSVIVHSADVVLVGFALFTILPEFGFDIRAVLAGVSITAISLGLGAQTLVRDAINGLFILSENQYARGDVVTIAGVTGTVEDVTLRRTLLRDFDGVLYTVPNSSVTVAANFTRDYSHVRVTIPIAVTSDLSAVRRVVDETGEALAADPEWRDAITVAPRFLRVDNIDMMGGVAVQVNGKVQPGRQWEVAGALRARLLEALQREGIKTPWG
ncbi:MAG: mechanosensitive ion channel family protein [Dehalococcoidia bacterium]|nr:MAG: mechanosensitive ion channel family protein [Dehalococcoidia bacterium]